MRAARAGGIPVPEVVAEGEWQGRPAVLLSWCPGRTLAEEALANPSEIPRLAGDAAQLLARLHRLTPPAVLFEPRLDWVAQADSSETALRERMRALAHGPAALLHLDYHPGNLITDRDRITGVIDWTNVLAGDRRADVARSVVLLRLGLQELAKAGDPRAPLVLDFERAFLDAYEEETGPLEEMEAFYAWSWAMTAADYAHKRGRPGLDFQESRLDFMYEQLARWKEQAGINA
jgi:aminoglycoside phosphotransferase (APT) family kinase protein